MPLSQNIQYKNEIKPHFSFMKKKKYKSFETGITILQNFLIKYNLPFGLKRGPQQFQSISISKISRPVPGLAFLLIN